MNSDTCVVKKADVLAMQNRIAELKEELVAMQEVVDGLKKKCRHLTDLAEGERDSAAYWRQFYKKRFSEIS